ncbi:CCA tRNA nucleotidyltransferase [Synechococcus sp. GFB01]|uniref:CCA tRNA nucleotidyltransferase n=1 Tax=Synechococcus sp. GFB01 TaxID=1662190 RepID=UPI00128DFB22|nr:CCA tRNA nucleotidyltransferase [Synechococcus sp. GFB01]
MPATGLQDPIVTAAWSGGDGSLSPDALADLAARLWQRLAPRQWPLPLEALPAGTALVGGAVRDALLGRLQPRPDLDLVVPQGAIDLCRRLAARLDGSCVVLDPERDIARLVLRGWTIDLARCDGHDLSQDLRRRDFTANAIALPLASGAVPLDPTGGLADLARGRLVAVSEVNLLDDPLRLLRGLRLSCELDLPLDAASRGWIHTHAARLAEVAGERVLAEVEKLAGLPRGDRGLQAVMDARLLEPWGAASQPGLPLAGLGLQAAAERQLTPVETAAALPLARLASLLDGPALAGLHASRRLQQGCQRLRFWCGILHGSDGDLDRLEEAVRLQLQRELEHDLPALLLTLPLSGAGSALMRWRDPADPLFHPRPPLDGHQLQGALALAPGRELGELLQHLMLERAFGRLPAGGEAAAADAVAAARHWLAGRHD